jgi:hypothetical protein
MEKHKYFYIFGSLDHDCIHLLNYACKEFSIIIGSQRSNGMYLMLLMILEHEGDDYSNYAHEHIGSQNFVKHFQHFKVLIAIKSSQVAQF